MDGGCLARPPAAAYVSSKWPGAPGILPSTPFLESSMSRLSRSRPTGLTLLLATLALAGCGDDDDPAGPGADAILGSWQVTSFIAGPDDLVNDGMDLDIILNSGGEYLFEVMNDQAGVCGEPTGQDCTSTGSFAYTATTVTIDDDDPVDSVTFAYAITGSGNFMTWTGAIGGIPVEIALQRL